MRLRYESVDLIRNTDFNCIDSDQTALASTSGRLTWNQVPDHSPFLAAWIRQGNDHRIT